MYLFQIHFNTMVNLSQTTIRFKKKKPTHQQMGIF